jgi:Protein of unknown function (DUF1194)
MRSIAVSRAAVIWITRLALTLAALAVCPHPALAQTDVDLKLVLAVDISMSMDPDEQKLQRDGYVEAFRDRLVHQAIASGQHRRIAVAYFEWAGPTIQNIIIPWRLIDSPASATAFAADLLAQPYTRRSRTSISAALLFARTLLRAPEFRSPRLVIDVSGDGVNNSGPLMSATRPQILADGITINGLPVLVKPTQQWSAWDAPDLDIYYRDCVIGGDGHFSIPILTEADFATATRQKLLREIAAIAPPARLVRVQREAPTPPGYHCTQVERRIEQRPPWGD